MISRSGSGDVGDTTLYTSALAAGPCIAVLLGTRAGGSTTISLKQNGGVLCTVPVGTSPSRTILNPFVLQPGDELTYSVENSSSTAWTLQFFLYPQGDVAYEAP